MNKNYSIMLFCVLSGVMANANSAIVYQSDDRYISHTTGGTFTPTTPYATFTKDWWAFEAGAFQNSTMTSTSMSGTGSTYAGRDAMMVYGVEGTSVFSVTFGVDQLSSFSLTGNLDTNWYGDTSSYVSLMENGVSIFSYNNFDTANPGVNPFSLNGLFQAGSTYQLILSSTSMDSNYYDEAWTFNLTTTAVPVPAAVWLLGSGLLGLIGIAKRKAS